MDRLQSMYRNAQPGMESWEFTFYLNGHISNVYIYTLYSEDKRQPAVRWDNVFTGYIISIFVTALQFAASHDSSYTRMIRTMGFIHFAFETTQSWYFMYSSKTAFYLSIVTIVICCCEAVLVWVIPGTMGPFFSLQFVISDTLSCTSSLCMMFNKAMPRKMRLYALALCLHYIGIMDYLYQLHHIYFVSSYYDGASWVMIVLFSVVQLYLCQNVVRGELNDIGPVVYDENKNSKFFILFSKYGTLLLSAVVIPGIVYTFSVHGTVEERNTQAEIGNIFAFWIWDDAISILFWPVAMFGIFWTLYLRATPHIPDSLKEQWASISSVVHSSAEYIVSSF